MMPHTFKIMVYDAKENQLTEAASHRDIARKLVDFIGDDDFESLSNTGVRSYRMLDDQRFTGVLSLSSRGRVRERRFLFIYSLHSKEIAVQELSLDGFHRDILVTKDGRLLLIYTDRIAVFNIHPPTYTGYYPSRQKDRRLESWMTPPYTRY